MLADSISPNHSIEVISLLGYKMVTGSDGHTLGYFLELNRREEKRLLFPHSARNIPLSLWPTVLLKRANKQKTGTKEEDVLFNF
jgi:hypothetical protein